MKVMKYAIIVMLMPAISFATPILDQSNDYNPYGTVSAPNPNADAGQLFTVGISGTLDSIELLGWNQATAFEASREHELSLFKVGTEYTPGNALATITQTAEGYSEQWFNFDFSGFNISVEAGDELLMLWSSEGYFKWRYNSFAYENGDRFIRNTYYPEGTFVENRDQIFRTYVTKVPEPSSALLLLGGLVLLITKRSTGRAFDARG
ncbi:PEP-CTERM sorting domain-containing protein [Agarivorans albus]|uniref:PEP-CTERM protein-sorting domain-containing protein n=1 Tax=Agarivorans albus MKT 106 TaxID=1331007 RepID=R9PQ06_AGAAL|nr:PEP-CTERM sorting domain-containing protein [Agarivorans albus]GAD03424.1 hypothetical protein AALB_3504 [Agarivorans albus MKT 106]